ncbi:hypothetical protein [Hymenobacter sp.]|uniref:hypothetical protein n=1 Tax=Hymenobacter sp. TaxID=1898978 RepID=UPI00286B9801|nr:hypothetical protein [Hymenobacter sp.]
MKRLFLLFLVPVLLSCEDATDQLFPQPQPVRLPAATQSGANTFGCRVNGQVWEASNTTTLAGNVLTPNAYYEHGELRLDAFRRLQVAGPVTNFNFVVDHVTGPGVYPLGALRDHAGRHAVLQTSRRRVGYATDAPSAGTLTITRLDTAGAHPSVAGRFELRAEPQQSARYADLPAVLQVTEGRFDVQLTRR